MRSRLRQSGFTLIEIAIVLLIVTIVLGFSVAMLPVQQELKQYRRVNAEMDSIIEHLIAFAQVNGRLPCPAEPDSVGNEVGGGTVNCSSYGGFVPVNTLGMTGRLNQDSLLLDPWSNPYRYYVSDADFDADGVDDFVRNGEMRDIGLIDSNADGFIDLDGNYQICDADGTSNDDICSGANLVFGRATVTGGPYAGAPFVLVSQGKNGSLTPVNDELENRGNSLTTTNLGMTKGPANKEYRLKNVAASETTFVRPTSGFSDNFDDVVKWGSPNILFSRMIEAGQLP